MQISLYLHLVSWTNVVSCSSQMENDWGIHGKNSSEKHTMRLTVDELKDGTITVLYHSSLVLVTFILDRYITQVIAETHSGRHYLGVIFTQAISWATKPRMSKSFYIMGHIQATLVSSVPDGWNVSFCEYKDVWLHI